LLDLLRTARDVYFDEVAQVVMPRGPRRRGLLGDAAFAVSLIAGKGATLALAGPSCSPTRWRTRAGSWTRFAAYEARLRPWAEAAQRMARRNVHLFTPATTSSYSREAVLRLARGRSSPRSSSGS
jgi:2-polyprenyl-6-methoxyphenol hydroxylase-like FAD-dependent oxidoreductase